MQEVNSFFATVNQTVLPLKFKFPLNWETEILPAAFWYYWMPSSMIKITYMIFQKISLKKRKIMNYLFVAILIFAQLVKNLRMRKIILGLRYNFFLASFPFANFSFKNRNINKMIKPNFFIFTRLHFIPMTILKLFKINLKYQQCTCNMC